MDITTLSRQDVSHAALRAGVHESGYVLFFRVYEAGAHLKACGDERSLSSLAQACKVSNTRPIHQICQNITLHWTRNAIGPLNAKVRVGA